MGRAVAAQVLLLVCFAAAALTAEATFRFNFGRAFSTYKEPEVPAAEVPSKAEVPAKEDLPAKEEEPASSSFAERFPNGYPDAVHKWDPKTGKYETSDPLATTDPGRYTNGYYNQADKYSDPTPIPTIKPTPNPTAKPTSLLGANNKEDDAAGTIPNRYESGYPASLQQSRPTTTPEAKPELRFPDGYYGQAHKYAGEAQKPGSAQPEERYVDGYYGQAHKYAQPNAQKPVTVQPEVRFPSEGPPKERYEHGYYPESTYAGGKPETVGTATKAVASFSSNPQGSFNAIPSVTTTGPAYVPDGAGCRTAYWAQHVKNWPSFFTDKSTVGDAFGAEAAEVYGKLTIVQALTKFDGDAFADLARTGCTALLNAYSRGGYDMRHMTVIEAFKKSLASPDAAQSQALAFESANVASISSGHACI